MADKSLPSAANAESIEEALRRISKKPGVRAWLMLDRSTGAVLRTNGQIASVRPAQSLLQNNGENSNNNNNNNNTTADAAASADPTTPSAASFPTATGPGTVGVAGAPTDASGSGAGAAGANAAVNPETQAATELAALVWSFLSSAGGLVGEIDSEDELKLLRLRTKKQEFVIVPEQKYLMVVIHDTPPA